MTGPLSGPRLLAADPAWPNLAGAWTDLPDFGITVAGAAPETITYWKGPVPYVEARKAAAGAVVRLYVGDTMAVPFDGTRWQVRAPVHANDLLRTGPTSPADDIFRDCQMFLDANPPGAGAGIFAIENFVIQRAWNDAAFVVYEGPLDGIQVATLYINNRAPVGAPPDATMSHAWSQSPDDGTIIPLGAAIFTVTHPAAGAQRVLTKTGDAQLLFQFTGRADLAAGGYAERAQLLIDGGGTNGTIDAWLGLTGKRFDR